MEQRNSIRKSQYRGLAGNSTISSHDLNRDVLSRALDAIAEYGPERLFLKCAKAVSSKLGIKPDTVHLIQQAFIMKAEPGLRKAVIWYLILDTAETYILSLIR